MMKCIGVVAVAFAAFVLKADIVFNGTIKLPAPELDGGKTVLQALKDRHSDRAFADDDLSLKELSGVLWAANGFNRPDKRTNATALNKQSIVIYVVRKEGAYRYDAKANELVPVCEGDLRPMVAGHQAFAKTAPVCLLIAAELTDPFYATPHGAAVSNYDAGIVSGNVYLYCSAMGLATVCRGSMDKDALRKALNLPETTVIHLNHPVGHPAK